MNLGVLASHEPDRGVRLVQILDLIFEDNRLISNDVGSVKTQLLRSGRRSRLSIAKSRRRRPSLCRRSCRCPRSTLDPCHCITTVSDTKHLFGHSGP